MAFDMAQVDTRMANNLTPRQMLDLRNQPGGTCVEYVEPQVAGRTPPVVDRSNQCPQKPFFNVLHKWLKAKGIAQRKERVGIQNKLASECFVIPIYALLYQYWYNCVAL